MERADRSLRLGYLVPEFPGQTHIFFWREIAALKRLGIEPVLLSSREADRRLQSHDWSADAKARTTYLVPLGAGALLRGFGAALGSGAAGWRQAIMLAREARGHGTIRLAGLALFGAVLAGHARRLRLDHIHCHSCANTALVTAFAHCFSGVPYSLTLHGPLHDYGPDQVAKWRRAAFGVAISRRLAAELRETLAAACPVQIEVAPMGVDLARFTREAARPVWTAGSPARIVSVGRLNRTKGHQDLIEAVALLRGGGIDACLEICGEDEQGGMGFRRSLEAAIAEKGLAKHVELAGAVSEMEVRRRLERAHVFALASHAEALGVAIMEAMALGCPVVTTAAGGVPELVEDGAEGLLVPPRDPRALARAIETILRDPGKAQQMADAARRKVERGFHSGVSAEVLARNISKNFVVEDISVLTPR